jgi:hypothetical protein
MALIKLNHEKIRDLMACTATRPADLAKSLEFSRQLTHYILHKGGRKHARAIADFFKCKEADLLETWEPRVKTPKRFQVKNKKARKVSK